MKETLIALMQDKPGVFAKLAAILGDQRVEPTDLKGIRWHPVSSDLAYDLCLLPDFLVIDIFQLEPTVENLLAGIAFQIERHMLLVAVYRIEKEAVGHKALAFDRDHPGPGTDPYVKHSSHVSGYLRFRGA